jgi:hypothetical protein
MAINSVSGTAQRIPQQVSPQSVNPQQVTTRKDADGDNDGTKAGQVEKAGETGKAAEVVKASTLTSSTLGSVISTKA